MASVRTCDPSGKRSITVDEASAALTWADDVVSLEFDVSGDGIGRDLFVSVARYSAEGNPPERSPGRREFAEVQLPAG